MAQLPRCVQQASWKCVSGVCFLTIRSLSSASSSRRFCSAVSATSATSGSIYAVRPSQSLLVLCGSSPRLSRSVYTDITRDRLRFVLRRSPVSFVDSIATRSSGSASNGLPALGPLVRRSFSSADASAVVDGEAKDSFSKEEKETQRSALFAEIEAKERELVELRNALRQAESEGVTVSSQSESVEDRVLEANSVEADEVDTEFYLSANGTPSRVVEEEDATSEARCDEEDIGDIEENSQVIYLGDGSEASPTQSVSDEAIAASATGEAVEGGDISFPSATSTETEKIPSEHPWPQWTRFLKLLAKGNYFVNEEGKEIDISSVNPDDYGLIKRACLNFARERDDIFTSFAQKDLEIIARFGCPTTDRKVVNAGKRLREYLKIDEVSICKPCALRPSCERADFRVASDHRAGTPEVIRLLSQYALNVSPDADRDLKIPELVQKSCANLLQQAVTLGSKARDPKLPKAERKAEMVKSNREDRGERASKKRFGVTDVEMKPGDWRCTQCEYVNFARNRNCRECDAKRPTPEMRPGDWACPECDFVNFSRNRECHECKAERPPGVGFDSFKKGSTGDREGRFDRGDRGFYGRDRESRDVDRRSSRFDSRGGDRDRGSFDRSDRSRERGGERGMDRRSRGDDERESFDRRSPRGDGDRGPFDRRSAGTGERGGRRNKYEEWKPNLSKKDEFVDEDASDEEFFRKPAKGRNDDEDSDDLDLDLDLDDDEDDVEAFDDEEFESMKTATSASRSGRSSSSSRRPEGRGFDEDRPRWEDDRSARSSGRGGGRGGRGGRGGDRGGYDGGERDSWSSGSSRRGGRGAGRNGGSGRGRGASGGRGRR